MLGKFPTFIDVEGDKYRVKGGGGLDWFLQQVGKTPNDEHH
jgi:hypothetical protein